MKKRHILYIASVIAFTSMTGPALAENRTAVFAGGCFWCMEKPFDDIDGVISTTSGFSGGHVENPTYEQVAYDNTGHIEVVRVIYDDEKTSYEQLLETYWSNVDPVDEGGQFCDRGHTYTTAIFYDGEDQKELAEESKASVSKKLGMDIVTDIRPLENFYAAEDYHQDFYKTNTIKYKFYRWKCGRDDRLSEVWNENAGRSVEIFE